SDLLWPPGQSGSSSGGHDRFDIQRGHGSRGYRIHHVDDPRRQEGAGRRSALNNGQGPLPNPIEHIANRRTLPSERRQATTAHRARNCWPTKRILSIFAPWVRAKEGNLGVAAMVVAFQGWLWL